MWPSNIKQCFEILQLNQWYCGNPSSVMVVVHFTVSPLWIKWRCLQIFFNMWSVNFPNSWEEVQTWDLKTHLNYSCGPHWMVWLKGKLRSLFWDVCLTYYRYQYLIHSPHLLSSRYWWGRGYEWYIWLRPSRWTLYWWWVTASLVISNEMV